MRIDSPTQIWSAFSNDAMKAKTKVVLSEIDSYMQTKIFKWMCPMEKLLCLPEYIYIYPLWGESDWNYTSHNSSHFPMDSIDT